VLPEAVTRNWTLKLSAFAMAVFLWAVVRAEPPDREVLTEVPVIVQISPLEWRPAQSPEPATVQVRFAGPARQILDLDRRSATVRVPLEQIGSSDTTVELRRDWVVVDGGSGLVVEDILPASVRILLERTVLEARPVVMPTVGDPPPGFSLAGPLSASPSVVRVRGPAGRLAEVDSVRTLPVDLEGLTGVARIRVGLDTTGLGDLTFTPMEVEVAVRAEESAERLLPPVAVQIEGPASAGLEIEPDAIAVSVRGPSQRVAEADLSELRLRVSDEDLLDIAPGESRRVPVVADGVSDAFLRVLPAFDSVTVRRPPGAPPEQPDSAASGDAVNSGGSSGGGGS
ncbi:MAG: hypothetical protein KJP18_08615, partial [Gemmatimonadetes bacterium]|nr:hypothetical protein [Gemmatimonadota bacterium]